MTAGNGGKPVVRVERTFDIPPDVVAKRFTEIVRTNGGDIDRYYSLTGKRNYMMFIGPWRSMPGVLPRRAEASVTVTDAGGTRVTIDVVPEGQVNARDLLDALAADPITHADLVADASSSTTSYNTSASTSSGPSARGILMTLGLLALIVGIIVSVVGDPIDGVWIGVAGLFVFIVANPNMALSCPHCHRWVATFATVCHHCGRDIRSGKVPTR